MMSNDKVCRNTGYAMSGLVIAFMLFDAGAELGFPPSPGLVRGLGLIALACTLLYAFPRTAALGAVLLTAYMGGAVATHVRVGSPLLSHVLFGVYLALLAWAGLFLRDPAIRAMLPLRSR